MNILGNLLYVTILYLLPAIVNRKLALKKNRNLPVWILSVFIFSWWSTLILAILPTKGKDFPIHVQAERKSEIMIWTFVLILAALFFVMFVLAKISYH